MDDPSKRSTSVRPRDKKKLDTYVHTTSNVLSPTDKNTVSTVRTYVCVYAGYVSTDATIYPVRACAEKIK